MIRHARIAFVPSNVSGVIYYRVWSPAEAMRKQGVKAAVLWYGSNIFQMHPWEEDIMTEEHGARLEDDIERACAWADVVVWMGLHTQQSIGLFREMKARYGKPFLTELDDYIFSIPAGNIASSVYAPGTELTKIMLEQIKISDGIICSTPYLANLYKPLNKKVYVVENSIDLSLWGRRSSPARPRRVTIGWMGGGTHNDDHRLVKDAVVAVLEQNKNAQFVYVSGGKCPEYFEGIQRLKWHHDFKAINKYPEWIKKFKFDIGIAPLMDNNFNRGKSNLRWLEYSALGIPCVASPLPHFKESIRHGETGFLASTKEEWIEYLNKLIREPDTRENTGNAARQEVKDKWNPKLLGKKYKTVIQEFLNASIGTERYTEPDRGFDRRPGQHAMDGGKDTESNPSFHGAVC